MRTHENSAQAAVASLGDELFLEPLGAGSGGISWGTAVLKKVGYTSDLEWLDPDTAGLYKYVYTHLKFNSSPLKSFRAPKGK